MLVVALAHGAVAAPKKQTKRRHYAIVEILVEGNPAAPEKSYLEQNSSAALALAVGEHGELIEDQVVQNVLKEHPDLKSCHDHACRVQLGDLLHVNRLLTLRIVRENDAESGWKWTANVNNFSVDSAEMLQGIDVPCNHCKVEDLVGDFSNSLSPLFKGDLDKPLCRVKVSSLPAGAAVTIDSNLLGQAPFEHTVAAGHHKIVVEREKFAKGQTEVDCAAASPGLDMIFTLTSEQSTAVTRTLPTNDAPARSPALKIVGGVLIAVGAAAAVAGGVTLGFNHKGTCSLSAGHELCPQEYSTGASGGALLGVGLVAVVGGVVALIVDAGRARHAPSRNLAASGW